MTAHDTRLALAVERHDAQLDDADRDAPAGAPVKHAACYCTDGDHAYPDRQAWVTTEQLALEDLGDRRDGHVIVRVTVDVTDATHCPRCSGITGPHMRRCEAPR